FVPDRSSRIVAVDRRHGRRSKALRSNLRRMHAGTTPPQELTTINSMLRAAALLLFLTAALAPCQDFSLSRLQGRWTGTLNQGILNLRVAIQFDRNGAGKLEVLDQQAPTISVSAAKVEGYRVTFRVDSVGAYFDGIVMNEGNRLDGE